MIDLNTVNHDDLVPLSKAAEFCPKRVSRVTMLNWAKRGVSGVRLPTIYCAGQLHTTRDAVHQFLYDVTESRLGDDREPDVGEPAHQSRYERAERTAQRLGV